MPVGEHSEKPEEARRRIERLLAGPYLELYGRKPVDGWTVWGNQIARADFPASSKEPESESAARSFDALLRRRSRASNSKRSSRSSRRRWRHRRRSRSPA